MGYRANGGSCPPGAEECEHAVEDKRRWHLHAADMEGDALWPEEISEGERDAQQRAEQGHAHLPAGVAAGHAVSEYAADQGADGGNGATDHADEKASFLQAQAVGTDQEARAPGADGIAGNGARATGEHDPDERRGLYQQAQGLCPVFLGGLDQLFWRRRRRWCAHREPQQQPEEDARSAEDQEGEAPAVMLGDPTTQAQTHDCPQA
ncbi:hypothetical protein D3C85_1191550 [compost metagenome]